MAIPDDLPRLVDLSQERMVVISQSDPRFGSLVIGRDQWLARIAESVGDAAYAVYVAEEGSALIGYIAGRVVVFPDPPAVRYGIVDDIALDMHTYHGGLGRELFATVRDWFSEQAIELVVIRVPRYHAVEQAFWRSLGAVEWIEHTWKALPGFMWMTL